MATSVNPALPLVLRANHKKFADEYLRTGHQRNSAIAAGAGERCAAQTAQKWLKRADVSEYIANKAAELTVPKDQLEQAGEVLDKRIVDELSTLAFANIADLISIDSEGNPKFDLSAASREQLAAVASLKTRVSKRYDKDGNHVGTDNEVAINLADKLRGLELLGKHRGLFKADEHRVVLDVADRLLNARKRLILANEAPGGGGTGV